jgi:hypothetical protein
VKDAGCSSSVRQARPLRLPCAGFGPLRSGSNASCTPTPTCAPNRVGVTGRTSTISLKNRGKRRDALLAFHRLDAPSTILNITFLSTNLIGNVLHNWREATGNMRRWNEKEDMVARRMASGLLWAEAGIRKIRHAQDLPRLAVAPALSTPSSTPANAVAPSCVASTSAGQLKPCHSSTK